MSTPQSEHQSRSCGVEPGAGVRSQARLKPVRTVGVGPAVGPALIVQPARPGSVVGLGAGAHLPAPPPARRA